MKNLIVTSILLFSFINLNAQSNWNVGISTGCVTNIAKYSSGNETANALFSNNPSKSIHLAVNFKYKISEKISLQSGFNFTEFGFTYGIAKDYSLLKPFERGDNLSASTCISSIPVLALINTPVNCNNIRFVFGLGATIRGIDSKWDQKDKEEIPADEGGNSKVTYLSAETKTVAALSPAITWQIGIEKVLRKGNTISFVYTGNQGLTTIAESTVQYTASNKNYEHKFINRGSYVSFSIAYSFMPFGSRKALRAVN